jgi:hypothetical protein
MKHVYANISPIAKPGPKNRLRRERSKGQRELSPGEDHTRIEPDDDRHFQDKQDSQETGREVDRAVAHESRDGDPDQGADGPGHVRAERGGDQMPKEAKRCRKRDGQYRVGQRRNEGGRDANRLAKAQHDISVERAGIDDPLGNLGIAIGKADESQGRQEKGARKPWPIAAQDGDRQVSDHCRQGCCRGYDEKDDSRSRELPLLLCPLESGRQSAQGVHPSWYLPSQR